MLWIASNTIFSSSSSNSDETLLQILPLSCLPWVHLNRGIPADFIFVICLPQFPQNTRDFNGYTVCAGCVFPVFLITFCAASYSSSVTIASCIPGMMIWSSFFTLTELLLHGTTSFVKCPTEAPVYV